MDNLASHFNKIKSKLPSNVEEVGQYIEKLKIVVPQEYKSFIDKLYSTSSEEIIQDFKNLNVNSITISLTLTALAIIFITSKIFKYSISENNTKQKKKKKKLSKAQKANKNIQAILDYVESNYIPEIDEYITNFKSLKPEDVEYKYKYYEEMLLKQLMKLDGIDVSGNEILRENRRKVIKFIQDHQKRLDKFKKEAGF